MQFAICNSRRPIARRVARTGGVYILVLGASLIAALLGLTALVGQRIQNRILANSTDIRQAQLNASSAVELGRLTIDQTSNWRTAQANGSWFALRNTGSGTCNLSVTDPIDANLADDPDEAILIRGTGNGQKAAQLFEATFDPRRVPDDCLSSASTTMAPNWQSIVDYYRNPANGTQIPTTSLPDRTNAYGASIEEKSFSRNPSLTSNDWYWDRADTVASGQGDFASSNLDREPNIGPSGQVHAWCLKVERGNRRAGAAVLLRTALLKPSTQYRVDVELYVPFEALGLGPGSAFQAYLITQPPSGNRQVTAGTSANINVADGLSWQTRTFYVTTPAWTSTTEPLNIYFALNSDVTGGTSVDFYLDNIDLYETNARFIYQTVLGVTGPNPRGIYWIDCQGTTKLIIERSRIFGTLLVLNPGPGSCVDYGPIHMSPAVPGYPALLVDNDGVNDSGNTFSIRPTPDPTSSPADDDLTEAENGVNFNPSGAPHKILGTDSDQTDIYDSEIRGLLIVSGDLTYANNSTSRGKVIVGGNVSGTGTPTFEYRPDSLLNPPPPVGGFYTYRYDQRPNSVRKVVWP